MIQSASELDIALSKLSDRDRQRYFDAYGNKDTVDFLAVNGIENLKLENSSSFLIASALARQAHRGLTTNEKAPRQIWEELCRFSGIDPERYKDIVDFRPEIAEETLQGHSTQVVFLKPIIAGSQPENVNPAFISWGGFGDGLPNVYFAVPSIARPGDFLVNQQNQEDSFSRLLDTTLKKLFLFQNPDGLPVDTRLASAPLDPQKLTCQIAARAARKI